MGGKGGTGGKGGKYGSAARAALVRTGLAAAPPPRWRRFAATLPARGGRAGQSPHFSMRYSTPARDESVAFSASSDSASEIL